MTDNQAERSLRQAAARVAALAERRKAAGQVKISISQWVPASKADAVRLAAQQAIARVLADE